MVRDTEGPSHSESPTPDDHLQTGGAADGAAEGVAGSGVLHESCACQISFVADVEEQPAFRWVHSTGALQIAANGASVNIIGALP